MTYGILVKSETDTLQIDSDRPLSYLKVTQSGYGSSFTVPNLTDLVYIRATSPNDTRVWGPQRTGSPAVGYTYTIYANSTITPADYLVLRPTSTGTPSTGYGIRVNNSDGQLSFDSGTFISGTAGKKVAQVVDIVEKNAVYGDPSLSPGSIVYLGADYMQVYVPVNPSNNISASIALHCYVYRSTTNTIRFKSIFTFLQSAAVYYNGSDIVLVK